MRWLLLGGILAAPPAWAGGGGGGGLVVGGGFYPRYGNAVEPYYAPGAMGCVGGTGFGFSRSGFRIGGEGISCRFRPGVRMGYGGVTLGYHNGLGLVSWGMGAGLGVGHLSDRTMLDGDYDSLFLYVKPEVRVGFNLAITGLELALHVLTPVNVAQWVPSGDGRGLVHPTVGLEARFLFGNLFSRPRRGASEPVEQPLAVPGPQTPPPPPQDVVPAGGELALPPGQGYDAPPPPQEDDPTGTVPDDAPLAIPADPG